MTQIALFLSFHPAIAKRSNDEREAFLHVRINDSFVANFLQLFFVRSAILCCFALERA